MKKFVIAAAVSVLSISGVSAADLYSPVPVYEQPAVSGAFNWTGFYVGGHIGNGWGRVQDVNNAQSAPVDTKGFFGGVQAGYNYQIDRIVFGAEADLSVSGISGDWVSGAYFGKNSHKALGGLSARVGLALGSFLPYVRGGLALGWNEHTLACGNPVHGSTCTNTWFDAKASHLVAGYVIGAGLEVALNEKWSVKGEYAYTDFGSNGLRIVDPNIAATDARNDRRFSSKFQSVKLGVNYRF